MAGAGLLLKVALEWEGDTCLFEDVMVKSKPIWVYGGFGVGLYV